MPVLEGGNRAPTLGLEGRNVDVLTSKRVPVLGKSGWEGLPAGLPLIPGLSLGFMPALRESSYLELSLMDASGGKSGSYRNIAV